MQVGSLVRLKGHAKDTTDWKFSYFGIVVWERLVDGWAMVEVYWFDDDYKCHEHSERLEVLCK